MRGIDISNWQGGLIPSQLDIDFCIAKATEGINFVDSYCDGFIQNCIENNILWGFYHFARENEPEKEAEFFYENCKNYFNHGIPVLDYETSNYNNREWCERFINRLHDLSGVWCMIYLSASRCGEYENSWIPDRCGLWVAGYPMEYNDWISESVHMPYSIYPFMTAAIWQFTSSLRLAEWNLDGNLAYMDSISWMKYANITCKPSKPETQKSIDDLVLETLLGEYGINEDRKRLLGDKYESVQNRINELYTIADEVIDGKWGNGWNRENSLNGAGYPYNIVQKIVNAKMS